MKQVSPATVTQILEDGEKAETALDKEVSTSPTKRDALYGGYEQRFIRRPGENTLAAAGAGATAGYTAAGIPGLEAAREGLSWYSSLPQDWQALAAVGICLGMGMTAYYTGAGLKALGSLK